VGGNAKGKECGIQGEVDEHSFHPRCSLIREKASPCLQMRHEIRARGPGLFRRIKGHTGDKNPAGRLIRSN